MTTVGAIGTSARTLLPRSADELGLLRNLLRWLAKPFEQPVSGSWPRCPVRPGAVKRFSLLDIDLNRETASSASLSG